MNLLKRGVIYGVLTIGLPALWYKLGFSDVKKIQDKSFGAGLNLSQRFKKYPMWDKIAEPFIIRQPTIIFTMGHSFLEGMASDNENKQKIQKELDKMDMEIDKVIHDKD